MSNIRNRNEKIKTYVTLEISKAKICKSNKEYKKAVYICQCYVAPSVSLYQTNVFMFLVDP